MEDEKESNTINVGKKCLSFPITQLSYLFQSPLAKCKMSLLKNPILLYKKKQLRNIIVFGMPSGLELSKNKTLLQGHEKKYKLPNGYETTKRIKQNKELRNMFLSKMPIFSSQSSIW